MKKILTYGLFLGKEFISPLNYILALVVGFTISLSQNQHLFSTGIPYFTPLLVQVISKSAAKFRNRKKDRLLQLPGKRIDPAFLINRKGKITASTGLTFELFKKNNIKSIQNFFNLTDSTPPSQFISKPCYSPITEKWYHIRLSESEKNRDILIWLKDITEETEYDKDLKAVRVFNNRIIENLDDLVVHNNIYARLAELILDYNFSAVGILHEQKDFYEGLKFKRFSSSLIISEPMRIANDSLAPVLLSRKRELVISEETAHFPSQQKFEEAFPFDPGVKDFIGEPIRNFVNYHDSDLSIIAFNKEKTITRQDHLIMETFVNTALVTHSLVELAVKNDQKFMQSINGLVASAEFSDEMTGQHVHRVNKFSRLAAELYGKEEKFCEAIGQVASVHDIGKVAMPHIIKLERKLTDEERMELTMHPVYGAQIISRMMCDKFKEYKFDMAYQIALNHHQAWNGKGYPSLFNSKGVVSPLTSRNYKDYLELRPPTAEEIPQEALFVSLADRYDALRSRRHYKPAFSHEKTVSILTKDDRTGYTGEDVFGPEIMDIFRKHHEKFHEIYESMKD